MSGQLDLVEGSALSDDSLPAARVDSFAGEASGPVRESPFVGVIIICEVASDESMSTEDTAGDASMML